MRVVLVHGSVSNGPMTWPSIEPLRERFDVVLLAVASSDKDVGLAAALTYGVAYSAELVLNLVGYYGQEPSL